MRKARVFISCGQRDEREKSSGKAAYHYFHSRGFEPYFAERMHSPEALTEHIFMFLKNSEYFVFIDFGRDRLRKSKRKRRGSLFVNQEIAIAAFLKIPGLGFLEKNIKREGILDYTIFNAFPFSTVEEIIRRLEEETSKWDPESVNELSLSYDPSFDSKNFVMQNHPSRPLSDWWHIQVENRNKTKHAYSCLGYISRIWNEDTAADINVPSIELLWSGFGVPSLNIWAGHKRDLDAFYVQHGIDEIRFQSRQIHTSNPRYNLPRLSRGTYKIEYTVIASNYEIASREFTLEFHAGRENIGFY